MADSSIPTIEELRKRFKEELADITDLDVLKDFYATELAKRDRLIAELQEQNQLILQSTFRNKRDTLE